MPPTGRIFLNYRRDDSRYATRGIYDRLAAHFGEDAVFMDVDTIQAGLDFVEVLQQEVQACDVLVAVVGKSWLNIKDAAGNRRLDNPEDFVRVEIVTALERNIRVIPVLLDGILMPRSTDLPDELKPFARRNALRVEHDSFGSDVYRLIRQLEYALAAAEESRAMKARAVAAEVARKEKGAKIEKLLTQADTAIAAQDWSLAEKKLQEILALEPANLQAQAKLEIVDEKLAALEEQKRIENREKEEARKREKAEKEEKRKQAEERSRRQEAERVRRAREEKARQAALRKERQQEKVAAFTNFMKGKGVFIGIGILLFACLIFGGNYLFNNLFDTPTPTATKFVATEAQATGVVATTAPTEIAEIPPTAVTGELGIGSTMVSEKDGMTLVYVPAGEFQMGSEYGRDDEKPIHTVYLDAYWIDQTEVTNAMYAQCVADGACDEPISSRSYTHDSYYGNSEFDNYPVIYVSWEDANNYCEWAERRLPSEAEWEKAAGWDEDTQSQRRYPWGSEINDTYANYGQNVGDTTAVGSYEKGKSFYGAYDMAGNVWEWTSSLYQGYPYDALDGREDLTSSDSRALRGGSWISYDYYLRSAVRGRDNPTDTNYYNGFRCSRSP